VRREGRSRWAIPLALVLALAALVTPRVADAHGMRSAYLEVTFVRAGQAVVQLRVTANDPSLELRAGEGCVLTAAGDGGSEYQRSWLLACSEGTPETWVELSGLGPVVSDAVAWVSLADDTTRSKILTPGDARVSLVRASGTFAVIREYAGLGVKHILTGTDHLLFLFLLVLLVKEWKKVLLCETAFTLSHSLSFSVTALGWIRVSSVAAEACIALSLLLLALDVNRDGSSVTKWRAALLALVFGLVHGLGFAGGLREIGLPDQSVGAALLAFGAGVEAGQVAFLAALLAFFFMVRRIRWLREAELVGVYAAGSVSAYWLLARGLACFGR
jgi:hypothetical protein